MEASIRNIRRVRAADLEIGHGITLVAGQNDNGKSSTLGAVAAALTGGKGVLNLATKATLSDLVHDGEERGLISITNGDNDSVLVALPAGSVSTTGTPPRASPTAAGIESLVDMSQTERSAFLFTSLKTQPKRAAIFAALRGAGLDEDPIARRMRDEGDKQSAIAEALRANSQPMDEFGLVLTEIVQPDGWNQTHSRYIEINRRAKGAWEQITKTKRYGSAIAASWAPAGWDARMDLLTVPKLEAALAMAREAHAEALRSQGGGDAERTAKQELADGHHAAHAAHEAALVLVVKAQQELDRATAANAALPTPIDEAHALECPHCGGKVRLSKKLMTESLERADTAVPPLQLKQRREASAAAQCELSKARTDKGTADRALAVARINLETAAAAKEWLTKNAATTGIGPKADMAGPSFAIEAAERALAMFHQRDEAMDKHRQIKRYERLIAVLSPTGLRRDALVDCVETFNETHLAPLAEVSGWRPVKITTGDDIDITYGGRSYKYLGQSAQFRVRVMLQIAFAQIDGSDLIIIDGADVLTPKAADGRGALFKLLKSQAIPSLVGMTLFHGQNDAVIDLAKAGYGRTYLAVDGTISPLQVA